MQPLTTTMLKNLLKLSLRSLWRQRGYTLLNIVGLGMGMALFLLIAAFVNIELRTDRFHANYHQIYRLETPEFVNTPSLASTFLATALPEALEICRINREGRSVLTQVGEKQMRIDELLMADSSFFNIFSFDLIHGDAATALSKPLSIVISESEANKLFGTEHPIGQTLKINNRLSFEVTGLMADFPSNSIIKATAVIPFHALVQLRGNPDILSDWNNWNYLTFVLLPRDHDLETINQKLTAAMDRIASEMFGFSDIELGFFLRPFSDIYFTKIANDSMNKGNMTFIMIYIAIGVFILFIAVINFINLSTAMAFRRAREVGLKKVLGSSRGMLIRQYLTESIMVCLAALLIALVLFEIMLPGFNKLIETNLVFRLAENLPAILLVFVFAIMVGALAGIYPAFYLTRFEPVAVLKGEVTKGKRGGNLRKTLIVFQFAISIAIILCTIVIYSQMNYARHKDLGFDRQNIIYFSGSGEIPRNYEAFKNELKQIPGVQYVGLSGGLPGYVGMNWGRVVDTVERRIDAMAVDPEFLEVYGLKVTRGRGFDHSIATDMNSGYILNETAVRQFNLENPVGVRFANGTVIGVIDDFSYVSVHHPIGPLVLAWMPEWCHFINVKLSSHNQNQTLNEIGRVWQSFAPDFPFTYRFIDEALGRLYQKEERLAKLFLFFSFLAIFVACLGLSGLALFTAQQRTKEVGIRKVLGASVNALVLLLTSDFLRWVLLANLIALPLAWYAMNRWLENFAFRISIQWWMFAAAAVMALLIAFATISLQALRTAIANPIESLKYE